MNFPNPFAISELLVSIVFLPLFLLIFIKGKSKLAKIYSLHVFAAFIWGIGGFLVSINANPHICQKLWEIAYVGVLFIPVFFYHAVCIFIKRRSPLTLFLVYSQAILFSILTLKGDMVLLMRPIFNSYYWAKGSSFFVYSMILWVIIAVSTHIELILYYRKYYPKQKGQIHALMFVMIAFLGGFTNFLPGLDIHIYPYGNFFVPLVSIVVTYAIFKHQFFDIAIVIQKGVIYSILAAIISILYILIVLILERIMQQVFHYHSLIVSIGTAFGLGLIFIPLRHSIQQFTDQYFFKGTQEQIAAQNELLRREVAQTEKHKAVAALASGIAHEVRNPLTALKTFYEHFPEKKNDPEFLAKFTQIAGKEIGRIEGLIQQLLDFAKPSPPSFRETNINKLIRDTLDLLANKLETNHIHLNLHLSSITPDAPTYINSRKMSGVGTPTEALAERRSYHLKVDQNQIKQALLNILLNAIDAMPNGGQLTVTSFVSRISSLETFVIKMTDTGSGIAPEDLKHIFEPFFSKKASGTGLGLAITQGIVQEHKGKIKVTRSYPIIIR